MKMKTMNSKIFRPLLMIMLLALSVAAAAAPVKKVLVIGDSMTAWLADRLNAYGSLNGFEVSCVAWDGATINKYSSATNLVSIINSKKPDMVIVSLGLNDLFEMNPSKYDSRINTILNAIGNRELIWVGPPSWPGKDKGAVFNKWLAGKVGADRYFDTFHSTIPRQSKTNPHPTQAGSAQIVDELVKWIRSEGVIDINLTATPPAGKMLRPKDLTYRRMKENL